MSSTEVSVGGWTPYRPLNIEDKETFHAALKGLVGVHYEPYEVKTQTVAGTNYRFKCHARLPGPAHHHWDAVIEIYAPLQGPLHIVSITPI